MFGEGLSEEVLKIATELDMTGAQANWDEFAANPGAITTDAIIAGIQEQENAARQQVKVDAVVDRLITTNADTGETTLTGVSCSSVAAMDNGEEAPDRYTIIDADTAIQLYEGNYYDRISRSLYDTLLSKRSYLLEQLDME